MLGCPSGLQLSLGGASGLWAVRALHSSGRLAGRPAEVASPCRPSSCEGTCWVLIALQALCWGVRVASSVLQVLGWGNDMAHILLHMQSWEVECVLHNQP